MKTTLKRLGLGALLVVSGAANAALMDNLDGTVTDTASGLMWTQNANLALTNQFGLTLSANAFDDTANTVGSSGRMTWDNAVAWIAGMNTASYLGHSDWRLPITVQPDPSCDGQFDAGAPWGLQGAGFNCSGSELGDLFYNVLGGTAGSSILTSALLQGSDPIFDNVQSDIYWSGTEYAPSTNRAWRFNTNIGYQDRSDKDVNFYVWAVRAGNAGGDRQVPLPGTLLLIGLGALGLRLVRRRAY